MRVRFQVVGLGVIAVLASARNWAPRAEAQGQGGNGASEVATGLVGRLDLEQYKATVKGLTQFGDRRQGTDRNRKGVDWIEAQLKSYGCTNTERLKYNYEPGP